MVNDSGPECLVRTGISAITNPTGLEYSGLARSVRKALRNVDRQISSLSLAFDPFLTIRRAISVVLRQKA